MGRKIIIEGLPKHTFTVIAGGEERGKCLQITLSGDAFVQLTEAQVLELACSLLEEFG
jgi:hypothetical protein